MSQSVPRELMVKQNFSAWLSLTFKSILCCPASFKQPDFCQAQELGIVLLHIWKKSKMYPDTEYILSRLRRLYMMRTVKRLRKANDCEVQQLHRGTLWPRSCSSIVTLLFSYFPRSEVPLGTNSTGTLGYGVCDCSRE